MKKGDWISVDKMTYLGVSVTIYRIYGSKKKAFHAEYEGMIFTITGMHNDETLQSVYRAIENFKQLDFWRLENDPDYIN